MQGYLLKNILICDPRSALNGQTGDLGIRDGHITEFGLNISEDHYSNIIDFTGCMAAPAFTDIRCNSSDPGYEHRETIHSLSECALAGGFSNIVLLPNSNPPRQSKSDIEYLLRQSATSAVKMHPLGAITLGLKTDDLTEMYDMKQSGAVGFANANFPMENIGTMSRALQYSKSFEGLIYSFCHQEDLSHGAYVNEGTVAVSLGLKGIPAMAEYLQVQRDIELADYHQTKVHISKVSTERSVEIIRQAKAQGIQVTADVAVMNLVQTDEAIMDFDSNLKLSPPLRQANDVKALWEGLKDGTIDAICSDHHPQETERKTVEFEYAAYGAISLQIAFSLAIEGRNRFCPGMSDEEVLSRFNTSAARVIGLNIPTLAENNPAELVIINPNAQTILNRRNNLSKSANTFYMDKPLPYSIEATFIGNTCHFNKN
jgi:dihydroorotase